MSEPLETWLALGFLLVLLIVGVVRVRQLWRGPIFPESPEFAAIERAMPAFTPAIGTMASPFAARLLGVPSPAPEPFGTLLLLTFFGSCFLGLGAALFNWPKAIVPPHRRDDPGLLSSRPFRGSRLRRAASAPMPELPRWAFGLLGALVLVSLLGVMFLGWSPTLLVSLALPLIILGGARVRG